MPGTGSRINGRSKIKTTRFLEPLENREASRLPAAISLFRLINLAPAPLRLSFPFIYHSVTSYTPRPRCNMRLASPLSLALIAVLPLISAATFTTSTATLTKRGMYDDSPFNVANSGATPAYQPHPLPILLPMSSLSQHLGALQLFSSSPILSLPSLNATLLSKRMIRTARASKTCLDSTANDSIINTLLTNGGVGATLYLCPNAVILLNNSIIFGVQNQTLQTLGATGSDRATLRIISSSVSTAIVSTCDACSTLTIFSSTPSLDCLILILM